MPTVVLRSVCCGIAGAVISLPGYIFAIIWYVSRNTPPIVGGETARGEVGWDLMTIVQNAPVVTGAWVLAAFAIGFFLGVRYFSKKSSPQTLRKTF
jgi:hypothetical protein